MALKWELRLAEASTSDRSVKTSAELEGKLGDVRIADCVKLSTTSDNICHIKSYDVHELHGLSLATMKRPNHPRATAHIDSIGIIGVDTPSETPQNPRMAPDDRPPEKLADPWLFDTEHLLRELARCREMILLIPAKDAPTHSAINIAINANWNLEQTLRYLLQLP
jgi:hypothetical protein